MQLKDMVGFVAPFGATIAVLAGSIQPLTFAAIAILIAAAWLLDVRAIRRAAC